MDWPLYWRLPTSSSQVTSEEILDRFLDYVSHAELELYPAQEEAILALIEGQNVILNTPTGSGKSLVAMALHFASLAHKRRSYYTCPIKALVNEKFRDLCALFGPDQVGMVTGDGSVNAKAPIVCCTAEILANLALREGEQANVQDVVMDEFHYYSDKARGSAWQIPLLTLPQARFLLMSATLGDVEDFARGMTQLNKLDSVVVKSNDRPVPLTFTYRETPLHETVSDLVGQGLAPVYLVNFSQREAAEEAQNLLSVDFASKEEKRAITEELAGETFKSPYGKEIQKLLRHGLGLHHAGLLPRYRTLVERLAQKGLLKVISGTDTLGVGVNVPIRTVLFSKLCKYDGEKTSVLTVREFQQISGRAGRRGFDAKGFVAAQAPAHVIENLRNRAKAANDPKRMKKLVMKTPPTFGFVMWSKETFERLINSQPEALVSRFQISHGLILNVLSRGVGGCEALQNLIHHSHTEKKQKRTLIKSGFEMFRALIERRIIEFDDQHTPKLNLDLQDDFSLNQTLSLYLLDAIDALDMNEPNYALDVLSLVESILEDPDLILRRQLDRLKTEKMAEMKAQGIEYDERIEELEKLEHPKPNREFIYETFNLFRAHHPWVAEESIKPKSVAREMFENYHSFADYIREYDLTRVEGLLLRYLSDVYKVVTQSVPVLRKNDEIHEMGVYFGNMVRAVDSSLLDDWEKLKNPEAKTEAANPQPQAEPSEDPKAFLLQIRNEIYILLKALARFDFDEALNVIAAHKPDGSEWQKSELEEIMKRYEADHGPLRLDPPARHPSHTQIEKQNSFWQIQQRLIDHHGHNDWIMQLRVDTSRPDGEGKPHLELTAILPVEEL